MRNMRSATRMVESRCDTSSDGTPLLQLDVSTDSKNHRLIIGVKTARRLVEEHQIDASRRNMRASPMRCFSPSERRPPSSPTCVSKAVRQRSRPTRARMPWRAPRAIRHHRQKGSTGRNAAESAEFHETGGAGGKVRSARSRGIVRIASITSPIRIAPVAGHKQVFTDSAVEQVGFLPHHRLHATAMPCQRRSAAVAHSDRAIVSRIAGPSNA